MAAATARRLLGREHRPSAPSKLPATIGLLVGAAVVIGAIILVDANWDRLPDLPPALAQYVGFMADGVLQVPTEDPYADYWTRALSAMIETLQMAWIGTVIGAVLSFPAGFLAARNVAPAPVVFATRQVLNMIRAVPEVVFGIVIMLPIFGLGPLAGALAIGVGSVGTLGKLTSEAVEGIDTGPVESARAAGAGSLSTVRWTIVPQVLPEVVAFWLYRFEINIRASAIFGLLGAGGIGFLLNQLFQHRYWDRIGITLVVIIVVTMIVDQISGTIRHRIIGGAPRAVERVEPV